MRLWERRGFARIRETLGEDSQGFVRLWERIRIRGFARLWERIHKDLREDFGRGFARIHETLGEDSQGFMDFGRGFARICET